MSTSIPVEWVEAAFKAEQRNMRLARTNTERLEAAGAVKALDRLLKDAGR